MNEYTVNDLKNLSILKNQLITISEEDLSNIYSDITSFLVFLDTVAILINDESAFLLFDNNIIEKIETVINIHRFDLSDEIRDIINDIIIYLNNTKHIQESKKKILTSSYFLYQEDIRKNKFNSNFELLNSISYDAEVICAIEINDLEYLTDENRLISSIYYLLETNPKVIIMNEDIIIKHLENLKSNKRIFPNSKKKAVKDIENSIKMLKKK